MNFRISLYCILLLLVTYGCSKPSPPAAATPPSQQKTTVDDIQSSRSTASKPAPDNTESHAAVHVIDADTGLPITHANVRVRWISDTGPIMCPGLHIEDGNYEVPTNGLKGMFYVGALADGYLPDDKENPKFPVEFVMKKGETIEVSGTIHHANGDPVTNGIINLRMINTYLWGILWPRLNPCSVTPDNKGNFILSHVPSGIDEVYARYDLPNGSITDFKDQTFSTSVGDVHLTLQLPPELIINGHVLLSSGSALSGAWVWTEEVTGDQPDEWNTKIADKKEAVSGVAIQSDAEGKFELRLLKTIDRYVIKAFHPLYAVTWKGPYSNSISPPDPVELIIQEDGARLYGRLSDTAGKPVTNCEVQYTIYKRISQNSGQGKSNKLLLDIAEDGNYISGIVIPGTYNLLFIAPGYYNQVRKVIIQENLAEPCDVEFVACCVVTGTVYDAETEEPVPGVRLVNKSWNIKEYQKFSPITDLNGKFWVLNEKSQLRLEFQHPSYAPIIYEFSQIVNVNKASMEKLISKLNPKLYMSKNGSLRVFGQANDGTPLDGYRLRAVIDKTNRLPSGKNTRLGNSQWAIFTDGEALFTNIYVMFSPVCVEVYGKNSSREMAKSEKVEIIAGEEVSVSVTLPPTGSLALKFLYPVDTDTIKIDGEMLKPSKYGTFHIYMFSNYDFKCEEQYFILNDLLTNMYQIRVHDKEILFLNTNVVVSANATTEILIDNSTNALGSIRGSVTTRSGRIVQCSVHVKEQETGKRIEGEVLHYTSRFTIGGLSLDRLYDLSVQFFGNSMTNMIFRNIAPNGSPIDIQLPDAYRITGNVIDSDGTPLKAIIGIKSNEERGPGEFTLYPVFPGTYSICVNAKDYALVLREVTIYDSNVDLGDIILSDKGIALSGRVVTPENLPVGNVKLYINSIANQMIGSVKTDTNGYFRAKAIPRDMALAISSHHGNALCRRETDPLSSDTDIGDIVLKPKKDQSQ